MSAIHEPPAAPLALEPLRAKPSRARRKTLRWPALALLLVAPLLAGLLRHRAPLSRTLLETLELRLVDQRFLWRKELPPGKGNSPFDEAKKRVLIVAMDSDASAKLGNPMPRSAHAQLVRRLKAAGASAIIFDVIFADPRDPKTDREFAQSVAQAGNVFLPFDDNASSQTPPQLRAQIESKLAYPIGTANDARELRLGAPFPALFRATRGGGHVSTQSDTDDKYRSAFLLMESGRVYPHVAFDAVCRAVWNVKPEQISFRDNLLLVPGREPIGPLEAHTIKRSVREASGERRVSETARGFSIPLNFLGDHRTMGALTMPYLDVLEGRADPDAIRGRVVIVGEIKTGSTDIRPGPFDTNEQFYGVETNATLLANLLVPRIGFLQRAPASLNVLILGAFGSLAGAAALWLRPRASLPLVLFGMVAYAVVCAQAFANSRLLLDMVGPLWSSAFCFFVLGAYRLVGAESEARTSRESLLETQALLGQYVNKRIAQALQDDPIARQALQIGVRREITVLFSDIRGFTGWSERHSPEDVKSRLDEYFPTMCEIAEDGQDGYIDKFVGDALMVVWNGFYDQDDHARRAVRAAWQMQRALVGLNDGWAKQNQEPFSIGIGVATGYAVFGSFGARNKKMVTVLGDTVNLGARLEAATKEVGHGIVISSATYEAVRDEWDCVALGALPIRGKTEAQQIYGVVGPKK